MSFGGQNVANIALKSFESQDEIDEKKRLRQEEWEKVRKADDPLECPEEETRSLYEQLQAVKDAKEKEYEEEHKLRNSVKGLEEEEVGFLNFVSERQLQIEKERKSEEESVLKEMRKSTVKHGRPKSPKSPRRRSNNRSPTRPSGSRGSRKSQQTLLSGAVKRKRSRSPRKRIKYTLLELDQDALEQATSGLANLEEDNDDKEVKKEVVEKEKKQEDDDDDDDDDDDHDDDACNSSKGSYTVPPAKGGVARVIGILPGIGEYSGDSSDSTSSESDIDDLFTPKTVIRRVQIVDSNN